jgi:hypothetical protein
MLLACVVGLVGAWLGLALLARETVPMGPFRVELDVGFGRGETVLGLPPFGALTADTHLSPLHLSATLQDVGVQRLTDVVNDEGIDGLVSDIERDARGAFGRWRCGPCSPRRSAGRCSRRWSTGDAGT